MQGATNNTQHGIWSLRLQKEDVASLNNNIHIFSDCVFNCVMIYDINHNIRFLVSYLHFLCNEMIQPAGVNVIVSKAFCL